MCWSWNNVPSVDAKMIMKPALVYRILCKSASSRHIKHLYPHCRVHALLVMCNHILVPVYLWKKFLIKKDIEWQVYWPCIASKDHIFLYSLCISHYKNVLRFCKFTKSVVVNLGKTVELQVRRLHLWRLFINSSEPAWILYYWMFPSDSYDCLVWVSS